MSFSASDCDSNLYGVDYNGKVWTLSSNNNVSISSLAWNSLPNPTKVSIKRLVSYSNILWAIGSSHQIYVYVPKRDIPIRVREEIYENQRWNPVGGFTGKHLLPTDRTPFSSEDGIEPRDKTDQLQSDAWQWEGEWQVESTFENQLIAEGWSYAFDFPACYFPEKTFKSFVRRRKLFRYRKYTGTNRWNQIESLHKDHTQEPFIDVSVGGLNYVSSPQTCCLWAVSILGEVYFRCDTKITNPEGSRWQHIPIRKGLEACQITVARNGTPFVVTWTGSFMYRIGLTPKNPQGTDWLESNGPTGGGGLLQLSAGINCLWAITRDKMCWTLKGNWPEIVSPAEPSFEWIEIPGPGRMKNIAVGKSDDIVLALSDEEISVLFLRVGISEDQKYGQAWKPVYEDAAWDNLSVCSSISEVDVSVVDAGSSQESLVSLKPDIPQPVNFEANKSDTSPNSFCWVDGSCASCLRTTGLDKDLEVGPWRDDILQGLQKLKMERSQFSYPDAIEPSFLSWSTKSAKIKFLHASRKSKWVDGQLEISNNNHLMFHENLEKTWLCSVNDVLSVFGDIVGANTLTCRIRNSLEPGNAEFVNFKFSNEKEAEEWRTTISELATKTLEDFSISDIWLTTREAEAHRAGLIRVLNVPVEAEIATNDPEMSNIHSHPLVRGFLPESEVVIDISIPESAQNFSINLKGRGDTITAFHFNPRFTENHVIRNSFEDGKWGQEENDGVFPFRMGQNYSIHIQCSHSHIITTVIQNKHKFIFHFKHRVPPKNISNLYVSDVNVTSVRYNPKLGETYELEFATQVVPGHFWKLEAGSNGSVWGIGYDLKVWCYTGTFHHQKQEGSHLGPVTDEQIHYIYENQRWNPITGFGSHALPTDRDSWTDETGRIRLDKDNTRLPNARWVWINDWEVDYDTPSGVDEKGWQYAMDFPASYHSQKRLKDFVRRRRWKRVSRLTVIGPWLNVSGMKLVDISIRMNEDCEWEVLGLSENGDAVVRKGITPEDVIGTQWESLTTEKPLVAISGNYGQRIWAVGKDGFSYIRYGGGWQMLDRPRDTPIKSIKVGSGSVWAVGTNSALYRRTDIQAVFPEGREWIRVCEGVTQVSIAPDGSLWALLKSDDLYHCVLAKRSGVCLNTPGGLGWEKVAVGPWRNVSLAGMFSRNK